MKMSQEELLFDAKFKNVKWYLAISGSYIDERDTNRNNLQRFLTRRFYCLNLVWLISHVMGEFLWAVHGIRTGASFVKLTYLIPCVTLCLLGICKSGFLIQYGDHVNDLVKTIKVLQADSAKTELMMLIEDELAKRTVLFTMFSQINTILYAFGLTVFAVGPVVTSWLMYQSSGKLVMQLPFLAVFPFDETDIRYWPFAYIHQMWSGFIAVSTVNGADSFYSLISTFLLIQFKTLHNDLEKIFSDKPELSQAETQRCFWMRLKNIVKRHNELIRCVGLLETIYAKSNLGNVAVSSIVICLSAFNVMTIDDFFLMVPFIAFLVMWTLQVYLLCYYSHLLIESSTEVSNAVYHSKWYSANVTSMKAVLFILTRAQKPCKLTAYGFSDLNLRVFSKIVSSAWSYFALLQTVYAGKK